VSQKSQLHTANNESSRMLFATAEKSHQ